MPAFGELVVMNEFRIRLLCPTPRSLIQLVGKDAHGNRDGDALDTEERNLPESLPIETRPGNRRVRQPGKRDVVQDIIPSEAFGLPIKSTRDHCQTTRVMIEKVTGYADGGVCDPVQRERFQPKLPSDRTLTFEELASYLDAPAVRLI